MNYTVVWVPSAEQELAALWMDAANRDAVTRAAHEIDQQLRTDAHQRGESRTGNQRILLAAPFSMARMNVRMPVGHSPAPRADSPAPCPAHPAPAHETARQP